MDIILKFCSARLQSWFSLILMEILTLCNFMLELHSLFLNFTKVYNYEVVLSLRETGLVFLTILELLRIWRTVIFLLVIIC